MNISFADFDRTSSQSYVDLPECFSSGLNKEEVRVHQLPSQDGSTETSIFHMVTLPTHHTSLFRSLLLSHRLNFFGLFVSVYVRCIHVL